MLMDRVTCAGAASSQLRASGSTHQHTFAGGGHNKHGERLFILSLTVIPVMPDGIVQGQFFFFLLFAFLLHGPFCACQKGCICRGFCKRTFSAMDGSYIYGIRGDGAIGAVCIGIPVVGIVIFRNAIGIRGFIAVDMLHFPIGTGTEVIMGVVDAGSVGDIVAAGIYGVMMDDVGMAEIVHIGMAEIHCIHGMPASIYAIEGMAAGIHCIHSRFKAVEGFDEGEEEKEDKKRRHSHNGQGLLQGIMVAIEPAHDKMENDREKEGCHRGQGIFQALVPQKALW